MKMKKLILGLGLTLIQTSLQAAPIVYFDFDGDGLKDNNISVNVGDALTASLYVSNVDSLQGGLLGWGLEISYDNNLISASNYNLDNQWFLQGINNNINNIDGTIELLGSRFTGLNGTIKLADISFDALSIGTSTVTLSELYSNNVAFVGFGGANVPSYNYDREIIFTNANAIININPVPLPPSILLFLSGIIGLTIFKKRKNH